MDFGDSLLGASGRSIRPETLHKLVEYNLRLLQRIHAASIVTQEKRLRKQNLSGDVKHVALANLKEIVRRPYFLRVDGY